MPFCWFSLVAAQIQTRISVLSKFDLESIEKKSFTVAKWVKIMGR